MCSSDLVSGYRSAAHRAIEVREITVGRAESCKLHVAHPFSRCFTDTDATNRPRANGNQLQRRSLLGQASPPHPQLCYCSVCITLGKSLKTSPFFFSSSLPPFFFVYIYHPVLQQTRSLIPPFTFSCRNSVLQQLGWSIHETPQ